MSKRQYSSIARAYAEGLFRAANKQGLLETIASDMRTLAAVWEEQPRLKVFLEGPQFATEAKLGLVHSVLGGQLQPMTLTLLRMLVERARVGCVNEILDLFDELVEQAQGIHLAQVYSARELHTPDRHRLQDVLERYTGSRLRIEFIVDPGLLGGIVFRFKDLLIDSSLRSGLESLRRRMLDVTLGAGDAA